MVTLVGPDPEGGPPANLAPTEPNTPSPMTMTAHATATASIR